MRLAAACAVLALLAAACGNSDGDEPSAEGDGGPGTTVDVGDVDRDAFVPIEGVPGVSDDEISYTVVGTKEGNPLGTCILDCYLAGIEAYFSYRNSEGGIYGRDLVVGDVLDDALAQNQQRALEIVSADDTFGVFQAVLAPSGWGDLEEAGIPTYVWGIHATESANKQANFPSMMIRCSDCTHTVVPYVASQLGADSVATLGYGVTDNSRDCAEWTADSVELWEEESGVSLGYLRSDLDYGLPNGIAPDVTAMKEAGVDIVLGCIDLNGMQTLAQELERQGMSDVILWHNNTYNHEFVAENADLFEGDIVNVLFRPFEAETGDSGLADFLEWMDETGQEPSELAMAGWINAATAFDGLLAAGPDFDRQKVIDATNAMEDYTADGIILPTTWANAHQPYTRDDPLPDRQDCYALVRVEDGAFVPYGDPAEPWLCWEQWNTDTFEPTPTNFG